MNTTAGSVSSPLISQEELDFLIHLIEKTVNTDSDNPSKLCLAGKSYFALDIYYRSIAIQNEFIKLNKSIDLNYFSSQALYYFNLSANLNHGLALHYLGHFYQNGIGVEINLAEAFKFYDQAVKAGYLLSSQRIAYFYQQGMVVSQDMEQAIRYYEDVIAKSLIAKEKRNTLTLGFCKASQPISSKIKQSSAQIPVEFVNTLLEKLVTQLTKKVENGVISALTNLGSVYFENKAYQNIIKAYEYLNQAAKLGSPYAQTSLGNLYYQGCGVKQDYFRAFELYQLAAAENYSPALISVGFFYQNGFATEQNSEKAKQFYEYALDEGDENALVHLGYCYQMGIGAAVDFNMAFHYYHQAANCNHSVGLENLKILFLEGYGTEQERTSAEIILKSNNLLSV